MAEIYAIDLDEELLSHLANPDSWAQLKAERVSTSLIEDDFVKQVYKWQQGHDRDYNRPATAAVLENQFEMTLTEPETALGDLLDRLRYRFAKNHQRKMLEELVILQNEDPLAVVPAMGKMFNEMQELLSRRGEMFGNGDFDRAMGLYDAKVNQGRGASYGHPDLDEYFFGMRGLNFIVAPPKTYKALALDTPIPTPGGWTTMGEIKEGDDVFGPDGNVTKVIGTSPVWIDRPCYRVHFSDRTSIVADEEHLWTVTTRDKGEQTVTTGHLRDTLYRVDGGHNHSIPVAAPLVISDVELPLDPYVLGVWLGDGTAREGAITSNDQAVVDEINLGLLNNKHIPAMYLRSGYEQRLALMQGLMDADGSIDACNGVATFVTTNLRLRDGVMELARSLGMKPMSNEYRSQLDGIDHGPKWHISMKSTDDQPIFHLDRKFSRQSGDAGRSRTRQIVAIEPVDSVPVRCITVDNETHLYLAGEGMVPTHNSWNVIQVAMANIMEGTATWLAPLELPADETYQRLAHMVSGVPYWHYLRNCITRDERKVMREAMTLLDDSGLFRVHKPAQGERSIEQIVGMARDAGSGIVLIDQLQYLEGTNGQSIGALNHTGEYWNVLNRARDLTDSGPIYIAHQFNRSAMFSDKMPSMEQIKGSSAVEETATLALGQWSSADMRKSGKLEIGVLCARNYQYAAWEMDVELSRGCEFQIVERVQDEDS